MSVDHELGSLRENVRKITEEIVVLSWERMKVVGKIGEIKKKMKIPIDEPNIESDLKEHIMKICDKRGIDRDFTTRLLNFLIEEAKRIQKEIIGL